MLHSPSEYLVEILFDKERPKSFATSSERGRFAFPENIHILLLFNGTQFLLLRKGSD